MIQFKTRSEEVWPDAEHTPTIWDLKVLCVSFTDALDVALLGVEELRWAHQGRPEFVRAVLRAILRGEVYDDSDPTSWTWIWYMSGDGETTIDPRLRG